MFEGIKQNLPKETLEETLRNVQYLFDTGFIKEIPQRKIGERSSWDEFHMAKARLISGRATCFHIKSGSVIVNDKRVIGEGYNGAPSDNESCIEMGQCYKEKVSGKRYEDTMNSGLCRGVHSEMNAYFNMLISPPKDRSSILYNTVFPCHTCSKNLVATRTIGEIVFGSFYDLKEFQGSVRQLSEAHIKLSYLPLSEERYFDITNGKKHTSSNPAG